MDSTITVLGTGTVCAVPDIVRFTASVTCTMPAVVDAFDRVARNTSAVTEALRAHGVADADLSTSGLSVQTETTWTEGRGQEIVGYTASTTLSVIMREPTDHPRTVAAAVDAGGDGIRIGGLELDFTDRREHEVAAREHAWADAFAKATQYAQLARNELAEVLEITEGPDEPHLPRPVSTAFKAASTPIAIERGEKTVAILVRVRWRLR